VPASQQTKFHVSAIGAQEEELFLVIYEAEDYDPFDPPDSVVEFNSGNIPDDDWSTTWTHEFTSGGEYVASLFGFFGPPEGNSRFQPGPQYFNIASVEPEPVVEELAIYTITSSTGSGGTIDPLGEVTLEEGSDQTFNITPQGRDYEISDVLVDGISVGAVSTYTFENVQSDHTNICRLWNHNCSSKTGCRTRSRT